MSLLITRLGKISEEEWLVNDILWTKCDPTDGRVKHEREIFCSPLKDFVLKTSMIGEEVPQSWAEGMAWMMRLNKFKSHHRTLKFVPTLAYGTAEFQNGPSEDDSERWAWNIQPMAPGLNAHLERDDLPPSPFMRHIIREAREYAMMIGLDGDGLKFRGEYTWDPATGICHCFDYGKLFRTMETDFWEKD